MTLFSRDRGSILQEAAIGTQSNFSYSSFQLVQTHSNVLSGTVGAHTCQFKVKGYLSHTLANLSITSTGQAL
ncbi:hypothetical protein [Scytonema sp. PRP1]|uniref:hypothetical protein n=1 Tax=Scytonema sp. PRP1 TaxID=3120513 RepID=UPI002FD1F4BB